MVPKPRKLLAALATGMLSALMTTTALSPTAAQPAADPLPRVAAEEVGMSSDRLARLPVALRGLVDRGEIPGAVVAVARRGRLVLHEAVGFLDREAGTPMRRDALFAIASMTKPWVGAATLMLAEEGRLALGDPVERFLPQLGGRRVAAMTDDQRLGRGEAPIETVPAQRSITLQDLLRHTAGLTYGRTGTTTLHRMYPASSQWASENLGSDEFLTRLAALPLHYQPGTAWEYSLGIDVAGLVVERVSGQGLGAFLEERLFRPLGMSDSGFLVPLEKAGRIARPQAVDPETRRRPEIPDRAQPVRFECGGGCGASTAGDYLRFAQMLLDGGRWGDARIMGPRSVHAMVSDQLPAGVRSGVGRAVPNLDGYGFGLTVAVRPSTGGPPVLGSLGDFSWPGAFGTTFWVDPQEELAVVFMAQTSWPRLGPSWRMINALVYQAIAE